MEHAHVITYCTNIHSARGVRAVQESVQHIVEQLRNDRMRDTPFPIGLRLSNSETCELTREDGVLLRQFRQWCDENSIAIACINGFPFGDFHGARVKDDVHHPDWSTRDRVDYTIRLASILAELPHATNHAGISTSPLSYAPWSTHDAQSRAHMTRNIVTAAVEFAKLSRRHDCDLHLDIEPEPDGVLATSGDLIRWFEQEALPAAGEVFTTELGLNSAEADREFRQRLAVCLDTCHAAVEHESPEDVINAYVRAGMRIGRIQASSAIRVRIDDQPQRAHVRTSLETLLNSPYLHQTVSKCDDGTTQRWPDLPEALDDLDAARPGEWCIHFHVPLFHAGAAPLAATQDHTATLIKLAVEQRLTDIIEAETYTWSVLPPELQIGLAESIGRELDWIREIVAAPSQKSPNQR